MTTDLILYCTLRPVQTQMTVKLLERIRSGIQTAVRKIRSLLCLPCGTTQSQTMKYKERDIVNFLAEAKKNPFWEARPKYMVFQRHHESFLLLCPSSSCYDKRKSLMSWYFTITGKTPKIWKTFCSNFRWTQTRILYTQSINDNQRQQTQVSRVRIVTNVVSAAHNFPRWIRQMMMVKFSRTRMWRRYRDWTWVGER